MVPNLIDVYQYHSSIYFSNFTKNSTHNLSFEIYKKIFKLFDEYYFVTNTFHMFKIFNVCWILEKIDLFNQIYSKKTKIIQDVMSICYPKINKKLSIQFLGGSVCFHPFCANFFRWYIFFFTKRVYLNFLFNNGEIKYLNFI